MKQLALHWGHPLFLSPYWDNIDLSLPKDVPMEYLIDGLPELIVNIKLLHEQEKNAEVRDRHIVIGAGATQILIAILAVLNKPVIANPPYFMRFPVMAELANVPWKTCPKGVEIITNPNNPDGKINLLESIHRPIYDLSYNWPQYTDVLKYKEDIMVFSLAKATGHASTRIGWAIFKDAGLATKVKNYIDLSTSGTSIESQLRAIKIISSQLGNDNTCFKYGEKILKQRHGKLNKMKLPFKKLSHNGMFLWIEINNADNYFHPKLISYTDGEDMGSYSDKARINIGCSEKDFDEFIKRLLLK